MKRFKKGSNPNDVRNQLTMSQRYKLTQFIEVQFERLVKLTQEEACKDCEENLKFPITVKNLLASLKLLGREWPRPAKERKRTPEWVNAAREERIRQAKELRELQDKVDRHLETHLEDPQLFEAIRNDIAQLEKGIHSLWEDVKTVQQAQLLTATKLRKLYAELSVPWTEEKPAALSGK